MEKNGTTANLEKHGSPPKLTHVAKSGFTGGAAKRLIVTVEELQRFTARFEESVNKTTIPQKIWGCIPTLFSG